MRIPARLLLILPLVALARPAVAADGVTLVPIKFEAFKARLAKNPEKARFTIVDAWATNCAPCKENFPHLVQMHEKFAKKGLAVISLSLDDPDDKAALKSAEAFLKEKKATFTNVLLDENFGEGFDKLNINGIPAVFIFGPDGKEVKRFTMDDPNNQFTYDEVEKAVAHLLDAK
jgi:thiol-disulfide isomerase/thioredoxin